MINPYQILEISPTASDEEVKRAYRTLSRKYHPDANVNNPHKEQAEEKFKEIQQAYQVIMEERETGKHGGQEFSGFGDFAGNSFYSESDSEEYQMHLTAAANYIRNGYFKEADNVLRQMEDRTAGWYYLSALANGGMGNNIMALEQARNAVLLEPNNMQYQRLVAQLESGGTWYQEMRSPYSTYQTGMNDCCMQFFCASMVCNCCYGGSYYGGYGPFCCFF